MANYRELLHAWDSFPIPSNQKNPITSKTFLSWGLTRGHYITVHNLQLGKNGQINHYSRYSIRQKRSPIDRRSSLNTIVFKLQIRIFFLLRYLFSFRVLRRVTFQIFPERFFCRLCDSLFPAILKEIAQLLINSVIIITLR